MFKIYSEILHEITSEMPAHVHYFPCGFAITKYYVTQAQT